MGRVATGRRQSVASAGGRGLWGISLVIGWLLVACALGAAELTKPGQDIATHVMKFLLFYAGVFVLIALTASVGVGLLATDRIFVSPGGRVMAQGVHRAISFGAVAFLVVHIVTEVVAGRSHPADAVVPFLDHGRTLYLGLGTVASDLLILVAATGIMRARFATRRPVWMWRVFHVVAYGCWILGILHGLLAGRTAKPYVDWSYGACVGAVAIALIVRVVMQARVRETAVSPVPSGLPGAAAATAGFPALVTGAQAWPEADSHRALPAGMRQYSQPEYGQPRYGEPPHGQEQYGQEHYGQPQYGHQPYGQEPYGEPPYGLAQPPAPYGRPQLSLPAPPQPSEPAYSEPAYSETVPSDAAYPGPASYDPSYGEPAYGPPGQDQDAYAYPYPGPDGPPEARWAG